MLPRKAPGAGLWRWTLLYVTALILARADVDGENPSLNIVASEVNLHGRTRVSGASLIKGIGHGVFQVRDKEAKNTLLVGTSKVKGAGPGVRIIPVEGSGVGLTSSSDRGGLFVSMGSGYVGISKQSKVMFPLHVNGEIRCDKMVTGHDGAKGAALLLKQPNGYHSVILGKADDQDNQKYSLGRGASHDRTMTFSAAGITSYEGAGKPPLTVYASPKKVLATVSSDQGNTFIGGTLSLRKESNTWNLGSNLDIHGSLSMDSSLHQEVDGVSMFFPYTVGKSPSFSIRAAHPARAKVFDTKFMITSGKTGTHGVGINTSKPKSGLDVRGHLHIQSDPQGDASIYFPRSGERPGLYLRSADEADKSDSDKSTRFYLSEAGMVGVNTLEPASGIDIQAHEGTEFGGDILIKQGNLRVHSGIYDLNKKYMLQLNQNNVFHALSTEDSLSVGKVRTNGKGEHQLHLAGTEAPTLRVDNTGEGPAGFALQSGAVVWTTLQDSENGLHIAETQGSKRPRLFLDKAGHLMVGGDKKVQPKYGLQLDTKAAHGAPENSLAVTKGGLHIHGGLFKKTTDQDGEQTTWQLNPGGYSNLNELKITNRLSIGRTQQGQDLSIQKHHSVSLGDAGFLYSSGTSGTISFNEYSVLIGGKKEYKLHNKEDHGASMHLSNDGTVTMAATVAPGDLKMNTLFVVDAVRNNVQFGKYAKFGSSQGDESSIKIPLQVQGDPETGQVAFGTSADAYGRLGSNNNNVMLSTTDGKKSIAVEHSSGMVGVGTQNVTEDLTLVSNHPAASIFLSSRRDPRKTSSMTLQSGGDIKLSASASSSNSGKLVLKEFSHIQFSDSKSQQGGTVFDRSGGTREAPAGTKFVSGKVGVGVNNPQRLLHVNGDTWWQGRLYITKGFAQDLLESESLIQVGESTVTQNDHASDTTDVVTMLEKLTHIVRQNKLRLRSQMETISQMEQQVSTLLG